MKKKSFLLGIIIGFFVFIVLFFLVTPNGKKIINKWKYSVQKADDDTNYKTIKKVEDTCRSMIASYKSDKITYENYISSFDAEKQSWGEQAKIRANKTAATYNEYILKNTYVWKNNIPEDIYNRLEYLE